MPTLANRRKTYEVQTIWAEAAFASFRAMLWHHVLWRADADEETSAAMFKRCLDAGINFFDTANVYSAGRSEEILGRLCKSHS